MTLLLLAACASEPIPSGPVVITGATVVGTGAADVRIEQGLITAVGQVDHTGAHVIDHSGRFLVPAFVDTHVHLAFLPESEAMLDGGIAAAVDWASPVGWLGTPPASLQLKASGPMVAAVGGYPTQTWGSDGYGAECTSAETCVSVVDSHLAAGARLVKLSLGAGPDLDDATVEAVVAHAHSKDLLVGVHGLRDADAARGARLGADILVHTPVDAMTDTTVQAWSGKKVISTLDAFGGGQPAVENLRKLRAAGATALYGTDFGNSRGAGIQRAELELMAAAGMDGAAILAAGTSVPAGVFGFELGIETGKPASFLVLNDDPTADPVTLARPREVWIQGQRR